RSFLHFTVGQFAEYACIRSAPFEAQRHADRLPKTMAERAADDLDARTRVERGHVEPTVVGTVGHELLEGDDPGLGKRCPKSEGVMTRRQQEAVAPGRGKIGWVPAQLVKVEGG